MGDRFPEARRDLRTRDQRGKPSSGGVSPAFVAQLESANVERLSSSLDSTAILARRDADGDNSFDSGEPAELVDFSGFDPLDPASSVSPNETDPGLDPPITDELTLDVEHTILPELVVRLDLTARRTTGILEEREIIVDEAGVRRVATRDDYQLDRTVVSDGINVPHLPDGTPWAAKLLPFQARAQTNRWNVLDQW